MIGEDCVRKADKEKAQTDGAHVDERFLSSSFFFLKATIQAHNLLPGSCNFESNTCGYTPLCVGGSSRERRPGGSDRCRWRTTERDSGVLLSPALEQGEWSCLRLVYQISGSGSLEVLQRTEGKSFDRPLWSSQAPSDSWVISSMDLQNTTEPYTVVLGGKPGLSAGSSVAVFEIHITPGYCLDCDFEESHLCGYSNQWNANVNWYVGGGGSQILHNNIPNDHTYNNNTGHLMYVDSIYAKTFKEVAKLVSPMTTVPMSGCLSFQYQRSEERGNLFSVFTRDRLGQYQELWRAGSENQNDWSGTLEEWIPVQVELKAPYSVQVVFEVSFNSARGGRVAVDDISFSPEFCSTDTEPTFDPSIANCDFESGFCRYSQEQMIGSSWRRRRLIGPTLPGNMKYCLRFYFSLRGFNQTDQALAVYLQQGSSQERIWTQGEKSRGIWITTDITFQTSKPAKVVFVSTCRSFWDCGSVALDDISLSLGDCELTAGSLLPTLPGHCDFEAGLCGYTQDKQRYYLHMEASPMLPGQSVRLLSRPLRGSRGPQCLSFYYHMYGSGTGQLSVHLHKDGEDALLWKLSGEQSVAWLRATSGPCPVTKTEAPVGSSNEIE
ncbi:hypothetical protein F7725_015290 [Dissostichus mawsoni]|uniref:MAM domain-containing protein n=1 Tax=Dissostichus mawsoni TaxID=36200 RepID=A0A7J5YHZ9_DISMA|nr:hypothetical protein F7725_015290 [Dissostichus mawsoni]